MLSPPSFYKRLPIPKTYGTAERKEIVMAIIATNKIVSPATIAANGTFTVTLSITAAPKCGVPGLTKAHIVEEVNPGFVIERITAPENGDVQKISATALHWEIDTLGAVAQETAILRFTVRYTGTSTGALPVNKDITYDDADDNKPTFPSPHIVVRSKEDGNHNGTVFCPEASCQPIEICAEGCKDTVTVDAGNVQIESSGRILQLNVNLKDVCPGKRMALGVILTELDARGNEHVRGVKTITVPAHHVSRCCDVAVKCISFVLPENPDTVGCSCSMCRQRRLRARVMVHAMDCDWAPCNCAGNETFQ